MIEIVLKLTKLIVGLFLFSVGIVLTINANLGLAPWDAFHQGLARTIHITIGQASIIVGIIILIANTIMGERVGWGTIGNMVLIGVFMDIIMFNHFIPIYSNIILQLLMMLVGIIVISFASYLYVGVGLGSGPRDGLMIILTKKSNKSVRLVRNTIEISALIMGFILGGSIGVGTVIMALIVGFSVQLVFKLFKFDVSSVKHRYIDEDIKYIKNKLFTSSR